MSYKCSKCQIDKARVLPSGAHGDIISVGERGVTDITLEDGFIVVGYTKNGKAERFVVRDWVHTTLVDDEHKCDKCAQTFSSSQGLGKHIATCGKK